MNVGKSTRMALVKYDRSPTWLADKMGISYTRIMAITRKESCTTTTLQRLATAFDLPVSEFCELSEDNG
jgi:hypothetical protein